MKLLQKFGYIISGLLAICVVSLFILRIAYADQSSPVILSNNDSSQTAPFQTINAALSFANNQNWDNITLTLANNTIFNESVYSTTNQIVSIEGSSGTVINGGISTAPNSNFSVNDLQLNGTVTVGNNSSTQLTNFNTNGSINTNQDSQLIINNSVLGTSTSSTQVSLGINSNSTFQNVVGDLDNFFKANGGNITCTSCNFTINNILFGNGTSTSSANFSAINSVINVNQDMHTGDYNDITLTDSTSLTAARNLFLGNYNSLTVNNNSKFVVNGVTFANDVENDRLTDLTSGDFDELYFTSVNGPPDPGTGIFIREHSVEINCNNDATCIVHYGDSNSTPTPTPTPSQDTGFRPSTDGFGFINPEDTQNYFIPLAAFEQYFGGDVTTKFNTLTAGAQAYYNDFYSVAAYTGECFGISGASAINFENLNQSNAGNFSLPYIKYGYSSVASEYYVPPNSQYNLLDILGYYQGVQYGSQTQFLFQHKVNSPTGTISLLNTIEQAIQTGNPIAVSIWKEAPSKTFLESHTVLAYRYVNQGNETYVYVYDSNHPANDGEYITFNTSNDMWYYNPDPVKLGPWGTGIEGAFLQVEPINIYTEKGILPLFNPLTEVINVYNTMPFITDTSGGVTGIINGHYNNNASGVTLLPTSDDDRIATPSSQQFITTTGNPYILHITNNNGTKGPVDFFGNNAYISINGITPNASDSAQIGLGSDGKTATVSASTKISNYSATLDQEVAGKSLVFTISNASINPGETNTFKLVGTNGELSIQDNGANKTYDLNIQEVGGNNSTLSFNNISIDKNMTQTWTPSDWDNLSTSPITLSEDKNSDGQSITTVVANAVSINEGAQYVNINKVILNFASPFVATKMRVSNIPFSKNQKFYPQWQNFANTLDWSLLGGEGKQTVYVQFMAANGTLSDVYSSNIILDTLPPNIVGISVNNGSPFTTSTNVTLKINAQDMYSGIQSMKVSNNNELSNISWQPYTNTFNWTLVPLSNNLPQVRWVYVQLEDNAGNASQIFKSPILFFP